MDTNKPIFDFLAQPENIPLALSIAEQVEQLKLDIHNRFWSLFNHSMDIIVRSSGVETSWKYQPHSGNRDGWAKAKLAPAMVNPGAPSILLVFGESTARINYRLFWGLQWLPHELAEYQHSTYTTLISELSARNIKIQERGWVRWSYYSQTLHDPSFIADFYRSPEEKVEVITGDFWKLFGDLRPLVEVINADLANRQEE